MTNSGGLGGGRKVKIQREYEFPFDSELYGRSNTQKSVQNTGTICELFLTVGFRWS